MPFAGRSHFDLIAAQGIWILVVFILVAILTRADRRTVTAALLGGVAAGAVNVATDAAAHAAGFWRYPEATTPFGPLLYYVEAGLGCGALALVALWLLRRFGWSATALFFTALAVYGPIRDRVTAERTHLIEFDYDPAPAVVVADALSSFVIPTLVAFGVVLLLQPRSRSSTAATL